MNGWVKNYKGSISIIFMDAERFKEILKETPSAAFFLYKPGKAVDFGLTSILFEGLEYQSAEDQLRYMQFPPEQEGNVEQKRYHR